MHDDLSRRSFLRNAACFGVSCVGRAFAAPHGSATGISPKLVLGVLSDIHVTSAGLHLPKCGDAADFVSALRWFDSRGVDGVIIAGAKARPSQLPSSRERLASCGGRASGSLARDRTRRE